MSNSNVKHYRVVQWATGNIGMRALRAVIEHPQMTLVGLHVHSEEKEGQDAGELCGLSPQGVRATRSIDDIVALKPDCVLYMPQGCNFDELCQLLTAGINIVTTLGEFHNPALLDPVLRERIEEACRRGNASIHSTGASPGFVTEALPLVLLSIQRRLDCLTINEFADLSSRDSAFMLFEVMGFGKTGGIPDYIVAHIREQFGRALALVAEAIRAPLDSYEAHAEVAVAREDTPLAAGVIQQGTIAAQRITVTGMRDGKPLLRMRVHWYCTTNIEPAWDLRDSGWHLLVEGDTPLDVHIHYPVAPEQYADFSPGLTAHRPVNAVPYLCDAAPGIRTTVDLPQIIPDLSQIA